MFSTIALMVVVFCAGCCLTIPVPPTTVTSSTVIYNPLVPPEKGFTLKIDGGLAVVGFDKEDVGWNSKHTIQNIPEGFHEFFINYGSGNQYAYGLKHSANFKAGKVYEIYPVFPLPGKVGISHREYGASSAGEESAAEQGRRQLEADAAAWRAKSSPTAADSIKPQFTVTFQTDGTDTGTVVEPGVALEKFLNDAGQNAKPIPSALLDTAAKVGMAEKPALDTIQKGVFATGTSIMLTNLGTFGGITVNNVTREKFALTLTKPGGKEAALTHTVEFADVTGLKLRVDKDGKENGIVLLKGPAPIFAFTYTDDKSRDDYLVALLKLCPNLQKVK